MPDSEDKDFNQSNETLGDAEIKQMKDEAASETTAILKKLEEDYPGVTEGVATLVGAGVGGAGSLFALSTLGYAGLSAAGITSGLATAGALVGGGMVAGIGVLAAPVAILGVLGYAFAKRQKNAELAAALGQAISKLYEIQARLLTNAEYFKEEIAGVKALIEALSHKKPT